MTATADLPTVTAPTPTMRVEIGSGQKERPGWILPAAIGAVLLVLVLVVVGVVATSGGDDDDSDGGEAAGVSLRPPTDLRSAVLEGSCAGEADAETCQLKTTFVDRSDGEEETRLSIRVRGEDDPLTGLTEEVAATGQRGSIDREVPVNLPLCVIVAARFLDQDPQRSEELCGIVTRSHEFHATAERLKAAEDLSDGECIALLPGDSLSDQGVRLWYEPVPCDGGEDAKVFHVQTDPGGAGRADACNANNDTGVNLAGNPNFSARVGGDQLVCFLQV